MDATQAARLAADSEARDRVLKLLEDEPIRITQTSGSSAGAGSGDFHHYRQQRRAELARIGQIEQEFLQEKASEEFRKRKQQLDAECAERTARKAAKRRKKKLAKQHQEEAAGASRQGSSGP
ncbi:PRKR-interacting protein 1 [Plasmodiophora brassicae]|uniref:PRKR-interacting protein 1 n=1 Tax=Plasmodiophora brassicae TaxID=37360 RepID=A0A0G4IZU2_PLABS|nr:hypothetical protein PBRA_008152 [Plasmodiophora brassicae]SPR01968.1 unnamed protein product [Plasmodiophora brassicae]